VQVTANVRYWHKADITELAANVRCYWTKADIGGRKVLLACKRALSATITKIRNRDGLASTERPQIIVGNIGPDLGGFGDGVRDRGRAHAGTGAAPILFPPPPPRSSTFCECAASRRAILFCCQARQWVRVPAANARIEIGAASLPCNGRPGLLGERPSSGSSMSIQHGESGFTAEHPLAPVSRNVATMLNVKILC
jgi:hypothetical protein